MVSENSFVCFGFRVSAGSQTVVLAKNHHDNQTNRKISPFFVFDLLILCSPSYGKAFFLSQPYPKTPSPLSWCSILSLSLSHIVLYNICIAVHSLSLDSLCVCFMKLVSVSHRNKNSDQILQLYPLPLTILSNKKTHGGEMKSILTCQKPRYLVLSCKRKADRDIVCLWNKSRYYCTNKFGEFTFSWH